MGMNDRMDIAKLSAVFDGARYVRVEEELGVVFVWHGGSIVNLYSEEGINFDCYSDCRLTSDNIAASVAEHICELQSVCPNCHCLLDYGEYDVESCPTCSAQE